jgi:hypothetical protein
MPPIRSQNRQELTEQEGRILVAIQAIKKQAKLSIRQAALTYDIPYTTLYARLHGRQNRVEKRANSFKLTEIEENSLKQWIISMDIRGAAPRPAMVQEMANLLLATRGTTPIQTIGKNWVSNYVKRHPELDTRFSSRYNYNRAKCEDPKLIMQWFELVQKTICDYGINSDDIYNFDETGFAMGMTATAKVITRAEYYGRRSILQPGNREWVTSIKCVGASGYCLPPMVIFKGKFIIEGWSDMLPDDWQFQVSDNGWTSHEIGLRWLQKVFIPSTFSRLKGKYRLLVLDGHGSHLTPKFDRICDQNDVILICMPPHSSHLLQPLDVGCFAVLKRAYGRCVEYVMRMGRNHIDKFDFLDAFPTARIEAFKAETVRNSFTATGLVPYDPNRVISKLNIRLHTPTPPPSRGSQSSAWEPKTPLNSKQLQKQAESIKKLLKERSKSPPSSLNSAIDQVLKACQMNMQSSAFLTREIELLRAGHEKIKRNEARSKLQIAHTEGLSVAEIKELAQKARNDQIQPPIDQPTGQPGAQERRFRAPPKCSQCGIQGHKRTHCPNLIR